MKTKSKPRPKKKRAIASRDPRPPSSLNLRQYRVLRFLSEPGHSLVKFLPISGHVYLVAANCLPAGTSSIETLVTLRARKLLKFNGKKFLAEQWSISKAGRREWVRWEKYGRSPRK